MSEEKGTGAKDEAKRELLGLLKDGGLSAEEHKKILSIATSLNSSGMPHQEPKEKASRLAKALLVLVALLGIAFLAAAWFTLRRLGEQLDRMGPTTASSKTAAPTNSGQTGRSGKDRGGPK